MVPTLSRKIIFVKVFWKLETAVSKQGSIQNTPAVYSLVSWGSGRWMDGKDEVKAFPEELIVQEQDTLNSLEIKGSMTGKVYHS